MEPGPWEDSFDGRIPLRLSVLSPLLDLRAACTFPEAERKASNPPSYALCADSLLAFGQSTHSAKIHRNGVRIIWLGAAARSMYSIGRFEAGSAVEGVTGRRQSVCTSRLLRCIDDEEFKIKNKQPVDSVARR